MIVFSLYPRNWGLNITLALSFSQNSNKTPKGKTQWREIKVAILARLGVHHNQWREAVSKLLHRRLVAILGTIDDFIPILELEAQRQSVKTASKVVWLSD